MGVDGWSGTIFHDHLLHLSINPSARPAEDRGELTPGCWSLQTPNGDSQAFRRIIWKVIVEDKNGLGQETVFEFKYIPALSKTTEAGKGRGNPVGTSGIEKRNLRAFLIGCILLTIVVWMGLRSLSIVWGRVTAVCR